MSRSRQPQTRQHKTRRRPAPTPRAGGQLRIIAGQWRGRKLPFAAVEGLRPTGDRVRETLFNWLQGEIRGARCLDLFSGSGALGLEALSRGAAAVTLVERHPAAARQIRANLELLQAQQAELLEADAITWLQQAPARPFELVFLDPPFAADLWQPALAALSERGWLAAGALVYVESPAAQPLALPQGWELLREKRAGEVWFRLWRSAGAEKPPEARA